MLPLYPPSVLKGAETLGLPLARPDALPPWLPLPFPEPHKERMPTADDDSGLARGS